MFDYLKIVCGKDTDTNMLRKHPLLDYALTVNDGTGEILKQTAKYNGLTFIIYSSNRVEIQGSFHQYWNQGQHNYNDFTLEDVANVINELEALFNIPINTSRIEHLEFGLNISLPFNPNTFINNLIAYKTKAFHPMKTYGAGNGMFVELTQYILKIYNKSLQYNVPDNILRYEKKVRKMENIIKAPVYLSTLVDPKFVEICLSQLLASFEDLIITESIDITLMTNSEKKTYDICTNPRRWQEMTAKQRCGNKLKFKSLINRLSDHRLTPTIYELLKSKGHYLTSNEMGMF